MSIDNLENSDDTIETLYYEGTSNLDISRKLGVPLLEVNEITSILRKNASIQNKFKMK